MSSPLHALLGVSETLQVAMGLCLTRIAREGARSHRKKQTEGEADQEPRYVGLLRRFCLFGKLVTKASSVVWLPK